MVAGILLGLAAALFQSVSYIFSATFTARFQRSALTQLVLNHITLGLLSALVLPLVWHPDVLQPALYVVPLVMAMLTYLLAQLSLYQAIKFSAASRVSPLLGLKVIVLAVIGVFWLGEQYVLIQWLGVLLCGAGAIWLSLSGGRISGAALVWVVVTCVGYAASDLFILELINRFDGVSRLQAAGLAVSLCYMLAGAVCVPWVYRIGSRQLLVGSLPAAVSWFLAVLCLFACFAYIGVVFGGVVQSARGLISIVLGLLLAWCGWRYAEPLAKTNVLIQRLLAALMMLVAIVLFSLGAML